MEVKENIFPHLSQAFRCVLTLQDAAKSIGGREVKIGFGSYPNNWVPALTVASLDNTEPDEPMA